MQFDPIGPQKFERTATGGRFDTTAVTPPPTVRIEHAAKKIGVTCEVKTRADGSLDFHAYDLGLSTEIETQQHGILTVAVAMKLDVIAAGGKLRCQSPFRDSNSFAAFLALGSDGKPLIYDSGTDTKHWLNAIDWQSLHHTNDAASFDADSITLTFASFDDLQSNPPPPREWLVNEWFPLATVVALFSLAGVGKTLAPAPSARLHRWRALCGTPSRTAYVPQRFFGSKRPFARARPGGRFASSLPSRD